MMTLAESLHGFLGFGASSATVQGSCFAAIPTLMRFESVHQPVVELLVDSRRTLLQELVGSQPRWEMWASGITLTQKWG